MKNKYYFRVCVTSDSTYINGFYKAKKWEVLIVSELENSILLDKWIDCLVVSFSQISKKTYDKNMKSYENVDCENLNI